MPPNNLEDLADLTNEYLPESMGNDYAFVSSQKVSLKLKKRNQNMQSIYLKKKHLNPKKNLI